MARLFRRTLRVAVLGSVGAAAAYFLDPQNGGGRRSRAKDQLVAKVRRTGDQIDRKGRYVEGKVEGAVHTVTEPGATPPADDKVLADKIKSEILGGDDFAGHLVLVDAADGVVALRGEMPQEEQIRELEDRVRKVPGVRDVENLVHLPGTPAPNKQDSLGA
jgi:hypothetical protein